MTGMERSVTVSLRLQEPGLYYKFTLIMTHICSFFFSHAGITINI